MRSTLRGVMSWCLTKTVEGTAFFCRIAERERNDLVAVALGEVGDGADQARVGAAQLVAGVEDGILADDGALFAGSRLVKSAQRGEGADVVDGADRGCAGRERGAGTGEEPRGPARSRRGR